VLGITDHIQVEERDLELVSDICYLGSCISFNGSCEKDVKVRIGKAATVFGKMKKIWRNNKISLEVKMRLYESIILSTLLYSAEFWPLTATLSKRLNAAHHRWQRSILHGVSKNVPPMSCYSLDIHDPTAIILDRSVTEKERNQTMHCLPTSPI